MSAIEGWNMVIYILILLGALFHLIGTLGLIRFPDVYNRSHAATKSTTLGVLCILIGTFFFFIVNEKVVSAKLLLGIAFVFLTSPVSGHLIGRAAYRSGVSLWGGSVQDDLRRRIEAENRMKDSKS